MTIEHDTNTNTLTAKLSREEYACFEMSKVPREDTEEVRRGRAIARAIVEERLMIMESLHTALLTVKVVVDAKADEPSSPAPAHI